jgi:rRNA maturation endonuclease Nob1
MKECPKCGLEYRGSWAVGFCMECGGKLVVTEKKVEPK